MKVNMKIDSSNAYSNILHSHVYVHVYLRVLPYASNTNIVNRKEDMLINCQSVKATKCQYALNK